MMDRAAALQARMPKPIGRPFPVKGADELYGELLLQVGRAKEASVWFDRALARTPNRSRAVLGLARAYRNAGEAGPAVRPISASWRTGVLRMRACRSSPKRETRSSQAGLKTRLYTSSILT